MNLMYVIMSQVNFTNKNNKLAKKVNKLKEELKNEKIKVDSKCVKLGNTDYYNNTLPLITKDRDVLKKPNGICKMRVNWKKKTFEGMSTNEIANQLKEQYGWNITTVDADHTRNKYKNKTDAWVVFDTKEEAERNMKLFNSMFITAIELDAIEEYKRFKENPAKRPLTFDKLVENAYELYEAVDQGEI